MSPSEFIGLYGVVRPCRSGTGSGLVFRAAGGLYQLAGRAMTSGTGIVHSPSIHPGAGGLRYGGVKEAVRRRADTAWWVAAILGANGTGTRLVHH